MTILSDYSAQIGLALLFLRAHPGPAQRRADHREPLRRRELTYRDAKRGSAGILKTHPDRAMGLREFVRGYQAQFPPVLEGGGPARRTVHATA